MSVSDSMARQPVAHARLKTTATLFVCTRCSSGKERRREFKRVAKATAGKRSLRVVGCGCLDICPKRGTAALLAPCGAAPRCAVIDDRAGASDALARLLLDECVGDPVAN